MLALTLQPITPRCPDNLSVLFSSGGQKASQETHKVQWLWGHCKLVEKAKPYKYLHFSYFLLFVLLSQDSYMERLAYLKAKEFKNTLFGEFKWGQTKLYSVWIHAKGKRRLNVPICNKAQIKLRNNGSMGLLTDMSLLCLTNTFSDVVVGHWVTNLTD